MDKTNIDFLGLHFREEDSSGSRYSYLEGYWYHSEFNHIAFKLEDNLITAYTHEYFHENFEKIITMNLKQLEKFIDLQKECLLNV